MAANTVSSTTRELWRGVRIAPRTLIATLVILTAAMAAAITSVAVIDHVVIRDLPYASPRRLVGIAAPGARLGLLVPVAPRDYFAWSDSAQAFSAIAASRPTTQLQLASKERADRLITRMVTANLFGTLGIRPMLGRLFSQADASAGDPDVAVLGYEAWVRLFASDPTIVGQTIRFESRSLRLIGILPRGVWYPMELSAPDIYVLYLDTPAERANARANSVSVVGRLRDGIGIDQARADIVRISQSPVAVLRLREQVVGDSGRWLWLLIAATSLVLIIASVNAGTLLVARIINRAFEFAVRQVLGQSQRAIAFSVAAECLVLTALASLLATIFSAGVVHFLRTAIPAGSLTRVTQLDIDGRIVVATLILDVCVSAIITIPVLTVTRGSLSSIVSANANRLSGGRSVDASMSTLLSIQSAVICVLLVVSALVLESFAKVLGADLGFDRHNVTAVSYQRTATIESIEQRSIAEAALRSQLLREVRALPDVEEAAIVTNGPEPLAGASVRYSLDIPGQGETSRADALETRIVTPGYFQVMGMQLVKGRLFTDSDGRGAPSVMLINEVAADRFFRGIEPVGRVVTFRGPTTIIGVLRPVRFDGPEGEVRPEMYIPADQERSRSPFDSGELLIRTKNRSQDFEVAILQATRSVLATEPGAPRRIEDAFRRSTSTRRFSAGLMGALGLIALVLGSTGVYGVVAFIVGRRAREVGVRLALGASRLMILQSVFLKALRSVCGGVAIGLCAAWSTSSVFQSLVFGINTANAFTYGSVSAIVVFVTLAATALPAWRAATIDPSTLLRRD